MFQRTNVWQVLNNLPDNGGSEERDENVAAEGRSDCHSLCVGSDLSYTHLPVMPSLLLLVTVKISLLVLVFLIPAFHDVLSDSTNAFSVLQYCYIVTWAIVCIVCWYVYVEFYHLWVLGYHHFHLSTKHLHGSSFYLYTAGLSVMCILSTVVRDYCTGGAIQQCGLHLHLSPVNYQQIIVVIITILSIGFNVKLMSEVYSFNESGLPADVLVDDLGVRLSQATLYVNIGRASNIHTVMEVQGTIIHALNTRIEKLNKQVSVLANKLENHLQPDTIST